MDSILTSIKKQLGIEEDYEVFDQDIILLINSAFSVLNQLGVGPEDPFTIEDKQSKWQEVATNGKLNAMIKEFVYLSVRMTFDPPAQSYVLNAYNDRYKELEWRLNVFAEE